MRSQRCVCILKGGKRREKDRADAAIRWLEPRKRARSRDRLMHAKGEIGKLLVASWFAQYPRSRTDEPLCIEYDASNKRLSRCSAFRVQRIDLLDEDRRINRTRFDELFRS